MQLVVAGRIEEVQRYENIYNTRLICPAADEYSAPQHVKVRSKTRIGLRDEVVSVTCRLGGYRRKPFLTVDKETGERVSVIPVDLTLDAIE